MTNWTRRPWLLGLIAAVAVVPMVAVACGGDDDGAEGEDAAHGPGAYRVRPRWDERARHERP